MVMEDSNDNINFSKFLEVGIQLILLLFLTIVCNLVSVIFVVFVRHLCFFTVFNGTVSFTVPTTDISPIDEIRIAFQTLLNLIP